LEPILAQRNRLLGALTCTLGDDAEEVLQQAYERALARSHTVRARGERGRLVRPAVVCVGQLIPELREADAHVLRRVDLADASIRDVARELGTTPNNVRVRLHRARAALRIKLLARCVGCRDGGHLDCDCA
jgi:DNA-directed RNA polymerase specialized sigma24 family protein